MRAPLEHRDVYTLQEAAHRLGISDTHYKKHLLAGQLPGRCIGERYLVPKAEFEIWLRSAEEWKARCRPAPAPESVDLVKRRGA